MRRLICALVVHIWHKTHFLMARLIYFHFIITLCYVITLGYNKHQFLDLFLQSVSHFFRLNCSLIKSICLGIYTGTKSYLFANYEKYLGNMESTCLTAISITSQYQCWHEMIRNSRNSYMHMPSIPRPSLTSPPSKQIFPDGLFWGLTPVQDKNLVDNLAFCLCTGVDLVYN